MKVFDNSFFKKQMATIIPQHGTPKFILEGEKIFDSPNLTFQSKIANIPEFLMGKQFVYTNCFAQTTLEVTKEGVIFFLAEKEPPLEECGFDHVRFFLERKCNVKLVAEFNGELLPGYNSDLYLWAGYYDGTQEWKDAFLNNSFKVIIANVDEIYTPISSEDKLDELINLSLTSFKPMGGEELKSEYGFYCHENRGYQACPSIVKTNGGKTFKHKLLLDERPLSSYPQIIENKKDEYVIIYDQGRIRPKNEDGSEILVAKVTKADIMAGKIVTPSSYLKRLVSRYGNAPREDSFLEQINMAERIIKEKPQAEKALKNAINMAKQRNLESYKSLCLACEEELNKK